MITLNWKICLTEIVKLLCILTFSGGQAYSQGAYKPWPWLETVAGAQNMARQVKMIILTLPYSG